MFWVLGIGLDRLNWPEVKILLHKSARYFSLANPLLMPLISLLSNMIVLITVMRVSSYWLLSFVMTCGLYLYTHSSDRIESRPHLSLVRWSYKISHPVFKLCSWIFYRGRRKPGGPTLPPAGSYINRSKSAPQAPKILGFWWIYKNPPPLIEYQILIRGGFL